MCGEKMVNGKHMKITWQVEDLKTSHSESSEVKMMIFIYLF